MTTITSVEELTGLPDGTVVSVGAPASASNRSWTKQGGEMVSGDFRLRIPMFQADISRSYVRTGPVVAAMQPMSGGTRYVYVPIEQMPNGGNWVCARYRDNQFRELMEVTEGDLSRMTHAAGFTINDNRRIMLQYMAQQRRQYRSLASEHDQQNQTWRDAFNQSERQRREAQTARDLAQQAQRTAETEVQALRTRVTDLERAAREASPPPAAPADTQDLRVQVAGVLDEYLRDQRFTWAGSTLGQMFSQRLGITPDLAAPATETVQVTVTVEGETEGMPASSMGVAGLPSGVALTATSWRVVLTIPKEVHRGEDACESVEDSEIEAALREKGLTWSDWTMTQSSCVNDT